MVALKRLIVVAMLALHLQPTLETSSGQIYDNMLANLDHTDNSRSSFASSYKPTFDSILKKFTPKPSPQELRRAKHRKTHKFDGHVPNPNWHIQIHEGLDTAKDKVSIYGKGIWYGFGDDRWKAHVRYPYYHFEIRKGVGIATYETGKVLKDYWWDLGNDKWRYGIKQFIGVVTGIVGYYTRTSPLGLISGPLFGYIWASTEHYIERRFFYEDYKNRTLEKRKDMHWALMHPKIFRNATKKPSSDESYENE